MNMSKDNSRESLTSQQRNLLLAEPVARLSLDRRVIFKDDPTIADRLDVQYLALSAIDFVMERSAVESGVSPDEIVEHVAAEAMRVKPSLTDEQSRKVGHVVLDYLANARDGHRAFRSEYYDAGRGSTAYPAREFWPRTAPRQRGGGRQPGGRLNPAPGAIGRFCGAGTHAARQTSVSCRRTHDTSKFHTSCSDLCASVFARSNSNAWFAATMTIAKGTTVSASIEEYAQFRLAIVGRNGTANAVLKRPRSARDRLSRQLQNGPAPALPGL